MSKRRRLITLIACLAAPQLVGWTPHPPEQPAIHAAAPDRSPSTRTMPGTPSRSEATADVMADHGPLEVRGIRSRLVRHHTGLATFELDALARTISRESRRHGLSPALVLGLIQVESGYYNFAVSRVGALGLMQIMPATGESLASELGIPWQGAGTLFDPEVNVRLGVAYLARLLDRYGHLPTALAAYNWGPGRISQRLRAGRPVPARYARDVLGTYESDPELTGDSAFLGGGGVRTIAATNASTAAIAAASVIR